MKIKMSKPNMTEDELMKLISGQMSSKEFEELLIKNKNNYEITENENTTYKVKRTN